MVARDTPNVEVPSSSLGCRFFFIHHNESRYDSLVLYIAASNILVASLSIVLSRAYNLFFYHLVLASYHTMVHSWFSGILVVFTVVYDIVL